MRKILYAAVLMVALSTLLVNSSLAPSIMVFAPLYYAPPNFALWGQWTTGGGSWASIDPNTGSTLLDAYPGVAPYGIALTWFETDSYRFTGPTQDGSVHFDNWLNYSIAGTAGFRVFLWTYRWLSGLQPELWTSVWSDAMPGSRAKCADVGIDKFDKSWPSGIPFQWTNGYYYMTRVLIQAFALTNSRAIAIDAKYDQVVWNAYKSPPGDWQHVSPPRITGWINPPLGPRGTPVTLNGTRFAPETLVYVYYDNKLVAKALSDGYGNFTTSFQIPLDNTKGPHIIKAIDALENMATDFFDVFIEAAPVTPMDITGPTMGVPDGKVDIRDLALAARYYGKTDPNVDPPEPATAEDISTNMPTLALVTVISIALFRLRKKDEGKYKTKAILS